MWRLRQVQSGVKRRGGDPPSSMWRLRQVQSGVKRRGYDTPGSIWRLRRVQCGVERRGLVEKLRASTPEPESLQQSV